MTGGGSDVEVHILYPKKSQLQNLSTQKITTFFCIPQKSLSPFFTTQKNPCFFFSRPKKIPASFIHPKKSLLAKISDPKKLLGPPPPLSLKYVSGAPGNQTKRCPYIIPCNSTPRLCLGCVNSLYTLLPMG